MIRNIFWGLGIGLLVMLIILMYWLIVLTIHTDSDLVSLNRKASIVLDNAATTLSTVNRAAAEQESYYKDTASHVKALTKALAVDAILLGRLVKGLDNDRVTLAANINTTIFAVRKSTETLDAQLKANGDVSADLLRQSTQAVASLDALIRDPANPQILQNLAQDASKLAGIEDHLDNSSASLEHSMKRIDTRVTQLTTPAKFAVTVGSVLLNIGAKVGSFMAGFLK